MKLWDKIKNKIESDPLAVLWIVTFIVFGACFWTCVACGYGEIGNPNWFIHQKRIEAANRRENYVQDEGYLGAPFWCECGYSPAIGHPSFKDCVEHYKRKYEECCNK